ncbi:MAG: lipase family protein [Sphingomonadaceae bacterium]
MELPELTDAAQVKALLDDERYVDQFTLAYIQMCIVIYQTNPGDIMHIAKHIANPKCVTPLTGCRWECRWGPTYDKYQGNLAIIATAVRIKDDQPMLNVVMIRATDLVDKMLTFSSFGDLEEIKEDFGIGTQVCVPWLPASSSARLSAGSKLGFDVVSSLIEDGVTIYDYLGASLTGPPEKRPAIIVAGHSLGGCLTSVIAPWLATTFSDMTPPPHVAATSFAGPSAGNQAYADYAKGAVNSFHRYYNTLDSIPNWWADLPANNIIFERDGMETPLWMRLINKGLAATIPAYTQPQDDRPIKGVFDLTMDWYAQFAHQHHAETYLALLTGKPTTSGVDCETAGTRS